MNSLLNPITRPTQSSLPISLIKKGEPAPVKLPSFAERSSANPPNHRFDQAEVEVSDDEA